jgi:hypothetical protein
MPHISSINDFKGYSKEINLVMDPITGKRIIYVITAYSNTTGLNKKLIKPSVVKLKSNIRVYNKFDQCITVCDDLSLAIKVYNQL